MGHFKRAEFWHRTGTNPQATDALHTVRGAGK